MEIVKFGTFQTLLCYIVMINFYNYNNIIFPNIIFPNIISSFIAIHMITIGIAGTFVFYSNFTHYKKQYHRIQTWQLILMDVVFHNIPTIHAVIKMDNYIIFPIPIKSLVLEYFFVFLYFSLINVRNVYIGFSPIYLFSNIVLSNIITYYLLQGV